ncbi:MULTISPECIES: hypothetical protein [Pseudomonas]|nr:MULTISPECIES: hypothetical protein [Pseudomonas]WHS57604.1 hypothetical protein QLH64_30085 [Pseudomonas brassicacearum]WNZ87316.1 hypothetical protein QOM10_30670 [Pseudomonas sp. P108]
MASKNPVWALGSYDPEMRAIRFMLAKAGERVVVANRLGRRCTSGNAYRADELSKPIDQCRQIIWVECRSDRYSQDRDLIVDHHNPGDPGYEASPSEYWEGSSIGQVAKILGVCRPEHRLVAASDHCLSAAMRGECPGIDPSELMSWRIVARSAMAQIQPWYLKRMINRAVERLEALPRLSFGGIQIVDASFDSTPELRDAAAVARLPILTTRVNAAGNVKVGLYGANPEVVAGWMGMMESSGFADHTYGNPFREYAGAILNSDASKRLVRP